MELTKNEKKVLILLLDNARISDSAIAQKMKISSQAVGKIRKKLEKNIIKSYSVNLNYSKIGINILAISKSKITPEGLDKGELEIQEKLNQISNIMQIYRLPNSSCTHVILYGFKDMEELDNFFHSQTNKKEIFKYIENKELFVFSNNSLIKNNPLELYKKLINESKINNQKNNILELENFKNKIS